MTPHEIRATLDRLIAESGADYAAMSRMLGKNPAYIQQFIKRGTPRRLAEDDRAMLARFFAVPESMLGAPGGQAVVGAPDDFVSVPRRAVLASAGHGNWADLEPVSGMIAFQRDLLRKWGARDPNALSIITVQGQSMMPTLADGTDIMINTADGAERLRDGVYVLRFQDTLMVKSVRKRRGRDAVDIVSDNPDYPSFVDVARTAVNIIGRVIWQGRGM